MTDQLRTVDIDAILRRLDVLVTPDPTYVASSRDALQPRVREARARDASRMGRLRRNLRVGWTIAPSPTSSRRIVLVATVCLLLLALVASLLIIGALSRPGPLGNGPLIVSVKGQLVAIDPASGGARPLVPADEKAEGVSRSPDGAIATYWLNDTDRSRLFAIAVDGRSSHELAAGLSVKWNPSINTWSPDSRFLASEVTMNGQSRVLVVDVSTGAATAITPPQVAAHNPLWSPDGVFLAFSRETATGHTLTTIRADGSDMQDIDGLTGLDVNGPDTWSPDGRWIYFGAGDSVGQHVFRVDVPAGSREQLSADGQSSPGIAASPDGALILFNVDASYGWDSWIARSDGSVPHLLLRSGGIGSWSADSQLVLLRWRPADGPGGIVTIKPDGSDLTILLPFDPSCRDGWDETCELGYGWGVPRP